MIAHYLKIALRNLLKYKTHSIISVICLAVGITCFSMVSNFINSVAYDDELPNYEQRINLYTNRLFCYNDIQRFEEQDISGMEDIVAISAPNEAEITIITKTQQEFALLTRCQNVSPNFFSYENLHFLYGPKVPEAPDEVIISERLCRKVFGEENPLGMLLHVDTSNNPKSAESQIKDFKIVNVVANNKFQRAKGIDCYFSFALYPNAPLRLKSYLKKGFTLDELNKQLEQAVLKRGDVIQHLSATSIAEMDKNNSVSLIKLLVRFISSLILLSGIINFLKFVIQMFYNRQRELAIRKCVGSSFKGFFSLLFAEIFWMMSVAFLLSLILAEVMVTIMRTYILHPEYMDFFQITVIYKMQFYIYIGLLLLCLSTIIYPIYKLRLVSVINYIAQKNGRHLFRNTMIGIQLSISIFFIGGLFAMILAFNEMMGDPYSPLTNKEEEKVISLSVNSLRMSQNIDAILSDINNLPDIADMTTISNSRHIGSFGEMSYEKADRSSCYVHVTQGDPRYFTFFNIPMKGKLVGKEAIGMVYVSEEFKKQLDKDNISGSVRLDNTDYSIAGTYKALYKEKKNKRFNICGSVFLVDHDPVTYYFRTKGNKENAEIIKKITEICRQYVPSTLPLNIRNITNMQQTQLGTINVAQKIFILLAIVSLMLVVLSIYSAISIDTLSRQKEVAIRKINGATPTTIALLFGKVYLILYLLSFIAIYPLLRLMLLNLSEGNFETIYRWDWGILLFLTMAFWIFLVTAYKIYKVMHLNPANIIKKE